MLDFGFKCNFVGSNSVEMVKLTITNNIQFLSKIYIKWLILYLIKSSIKFQKYKKKNITHTFMGFVKTDVKILMNEHSIRFSIANAINNVFFD